MIPWAFLFGLGVFLAAGAAVLAVVGALARKHPAEKDSLQIAVLACAGIFGVLFFFQNVLAHDALWLYAHLRSALVDGDLDLYDEIVLHNPHAMTLPAPSAPIAPLGAPLLSAPAVLAARPIAALLAHEGVTPGWDGYDPLETAAVTWTALLLALGGVALTYRCARPLAGGAAATVAVAALLYATPLAFFAFTWPGHAISASLFAGAAFLCVWQRDDSDPSPWRALLLGLLGGALALIDPRNAVYLALPLIDAAARTLRPDTRRAAWQRFALLSGGAVVGFSPQWAAWLASGGGPLAHLRSGADPLSSPSTWTPLYAVGVAGILLLRRSHPRWHRGLLLLVALQICVARTPLPAWPALAIGLAVAIERLARRAGFFAAALATVPCVYWNLLLAAQARLGWIPHDRPVTLAAAGAHQLREAPGALVRGLCGNAGWNQVTLIEQLRAAVEVGSLRATLFWLAELAIAAVVVALWMKWCASAPKALPRSGARVTLALGATCLLAACGVAAVARDHGRTRLLAEVGATPFLVPPGAQRVLELEPPGPPAADRRGAAIAWRADALGGDPARLRLDLVSFLRDSGHLSEGTLVAAIDLHGPGCPEVSLPVRAGYETAETAPERAERQGAMRHGLSYAGVVQSWRQDDLDLGHSFRHAYLASWRIAPGCRPDTVLVRVDQHGADLEIRSLTVALVPDGGGFAPRK